MFTKLDALRRAEELITDGTPASLRYACLQLRFCLELIAYDKLQAYSARVPPSLYAKWQPPQLFRALEQLEPGSTHDKVVQFVRQADDGSPAGEWKTLGIHRTVPIGALTKFYHKLGNFLHAPMPQPARGKPARAPSAEELGKIVEALRPAAECRFDGSMAAMFHFQCDCCEYEVVANSEGAASLGRAECLNPACGAVYRIYAADGQAERYELDATEFECLACGHPTAVENRLLDLGLTFRCTECGEEHELASRNWGYARSSELRRAREEC